MGKGKRSQRIPLILWGEGHTEQLFLELFKQRRADLFPKILLDAKLASHPILKELSLFLRLFEP